MGIGRGLRDHDRYAATLDGMSERALIADFTKLGAVLGMREVNAYTKVKAVGLRNAIKQELALRRQQQRLERP